LGACGVQPDVTGAWTISITPTDADAGVPTVPRGDTVHADLQQVKPPGVLTLSRLVYGTFTSDDPGFFTTLSIPQLVNNNGSKTGSLLGCQIQLNVPLMMPVSDDDMPPGPLKLSLGGVISAPGTIVGDPTLSSVILSEDMTMTSRTLAWTGAKQ
jgi:hypothetical protein